jgi:hypothetical protein
VGLDSLEHGLFVDTEFDPRKQPDVCPECNWPGTVGLEINSGQVRYTIDALLERHVAVTSPLAIIEHGLPSWGAASSQRRILSVKTPEEGIRDTAHEKHASRRQG